MLVERLFSRTPLHDPFPEDPSLSCWPRASESPRGRIVENDLSTDIRT